jgi:hypothetical protein
MWTIQEAVGKTIAQAGLNVYESERDVVNTPAAVVKPFDANYQVAMRMGGDKYRFDIFILVARTDTASAQKNLSQYITGQGPKSVREFIFRNSALGLDDVDSIVEKMWGYDGKFDTATTNFVGAALRLCVTVT